VHRYKHTYRRFVLVTGRTFLKEKYNNEDGKSRYERVRSSYIDFAFGVLSWKTTINQ
jgi:hypothetical protein